MRHIFFKQMIILLLCVPFILFSSHESSAQNPVYNLPANELATEIINDLKNANTQEEKEQVLEVKYGAPKNSIPIQIKEAIRKENYAQLYSILENNKDKLIGSIRNLNDLQADVKYYYKSKNDLLSKVNELKTLRNELTPSSYAKYMEKARALDKKDKKLVINKNGILEINTSVAAKLEQDVGDLDKALSVLDDICKGVCKPTN